MSKETPFIRFCIFLGKTLFKKPQVIYDEEPTDGGCVFLMNHAGASGPVYAFLYLKAPKKIWFIHHACEPNKNANYIFHDVFYGRSKKCKKLWMFISKITGKLAVPLFDYVDGVKVYHDERVKETFSQSVSALSEGKNLVIFPESPKKHSEYVSEFQNGYAMTAAYYYQATGKKLKFYPVYHAPKLRRMEIGRPVEYDPTNDPKLECRRISAEAIKEIDRIGASFPKHTTRPFLLDAWYKYYNEYVNNFREYWKLFD